MFYLIIWQKKLYCCFEEMCEHMRLVFCGVIFIPSVLLNEVNTRNLLGLFFFLYIRYMCMLSWCSSEQYTEVQTGRDLCCSTKCIL